MSSDHQLHKPLQLTGEVVVDVLLKEGGVDVLHYDTLVRVFQGEKIQRLLTAATTSKDVDATNNYEFFEYIGDAVINRFIIEYIRNSYPDIACSAHNVGILTKLRSVFVGKRNLCRCSVKIGLHKYINTSLALDWNRLETTAVSESTYAASSTIFDDPMPFVNREVESLMEDVLESFVGLVWYCMECDSNTDTAMINDIVRTLVWNVIGSGAGHVEPTYERLNSARDRLQIATKELYDNRITIQAVPSVSKSGFTATVYHDNETVVSVGYGTSTRDAIFEASSAALRQLEGCCDYVPVTSRARHIRVDQLLSERGVFDDEYRQKNLERFRCMLTAMSVPLDLMSFDLTDYEIVKIQSVFSDACFDVDVNFNLEHFYADALMKQIINTVTLHKYPTLRCSVGIQILQSVNEKFRSFRALLSSKLGLMDIASISTDTLMQRVPTELAQTCMFDGMISVVHNVIEVRSPGRGDAVVTSFIDKCYKCIGMNISYEYLVSPQLRLLHMAKYYNLNLTYDVEVRQPNVITNYRQGSLVVQNKFSSAQPQSKTHATQQHDDDDDERYLVMKKSFNKIDVGTVRAIDEKAMKTKLAVRAITMLNQRGMVEVPPDVYLLNSSNCYISNTSLW